LSNKVILSLDSTIPDNIGITTTKSACLCEGENITLNATTGTGLTYQWFRGSDLLPDQTAPSIVASQSGIYSVKVSPEYPGVEITSAPLEVTVNPIPTAEIIPSGDLSFCPGGKVNFSTTASNDLTYSWMKGTTRIQGSVTSLDITSSGTYSLVTNAYGCSATSAPVAVNVYSATDPACTTGVETNPILFKVYPNPFKDHLIVETTTLNTDPLMAELFDGTGNLVFKQQLEKGTTKISIPVTTSGFYTLRVSNKDMIKNFKLSSL